MIKVIINQVIKQTQVIFYLHAAEMNNFMFYL